MRSWCERTVLTTLVLATPAVAFPWGADVHRLVNRAAAGLLPPSFAPFAHWADSLEYLATAADARRCCDEDEAMRHYIDIDAYDEFFAGTLPRTFPAMVQRYGLEQVHANGIVPWAIESTLAALTESFRRRDWPRAVATAADLGHYVADSHQPLHLTVNYDGQLSGQRGIHHRYESVLTEIHLRELEPERGRLSAYVQPLDEVFAWIEAIYSGVRIVLRADYVATRAAGGRPEGSVYYDVLWRETGALTREWVRDASLAVAALWYTAWLDAGEPELPGASAAAFPLSALRLLPNEPNPFHERTTLRFEVPQAGVTALQVFDVRGRHVRTLLQVDPGRGERSLVWDARDESGRPVASGSYLLRLHQAGRSVERRLIVLH